MRHQGDARWGHALRRALPPAVVGAVLWWQERFRAPLLLWALAATVLLAGLVWPRAAARLDAALARLAVRAADAVFAALSGLLWLVVVVPTWALSRLVRLSPLDEGWTTVRSAWVGVDTDRRRGADGAPPGPSRMGAREGRPGPRVRRRRLLRAFAPAAVVVVLVGADAAITREPAADPGLTNVAFDPYGHDGEPWARDLQQEFAAAPATHDYALGVRLGDVDGRYLDVVDGRRRSYVPDDARLTVWFFGGSTMHGFLQRDEHTIPSVVAREAEAAGLPIAPVNFGVSGDVSWVATLRFAEALTSDLPRPDLVVFYDGANEWSLAQERARAGALDPAVDDRLPISEAERDLHGFPRRPAAVITPAQQRAAIEVGAAQYRRSVELARDLAEQAGVPIVHLWQPHLISKELSPADQELLSRLGLGQAWAAGARRDYAEMRRRSGVDPIDLSAALDRVTRPVYLDPSHTNELGARTVGAAIYRALAPALTLLAAAR